MPGRVFSSGEYAFGFNGMLKNSEIAEGNYDFGARTYDGRIGRWWGIDPLMDNFPNASPYNFVLNSPIIAMDPDGQKLILLGDATNRAKALSHLEKSFDSKIKLSVDKSNVVMIHRIVVDKEGKESTQILDMSNPANQDWAKQHLSAGQAEALTELSNVVNDKGVTVQNYVLSDKESGMALIGGYGAWSDKTGKKAGNTMDVKDSENIEKFSMGLLSAGGNILHEILEPYYALQSQEGINTSNNESFVAHHNKTWGVQGRLDGVQISVYSGTQWNGGNKNGTTLYFVKTVDSRNMKLTIELEIKNMDVKSGWTTRGWWAPTATDKAPENVSEDGRMPENYAK